MRPFHNGPKLMENVGRDASILLSQGSSRSGLAGYGDRPESCNNLVCKSLQTCNRSDENQGNDKSLLDQIPSCLPRNQSIDLGTDSPEIKPYEAFRCPIERGLVRLRERAHAKQLLCCVNLSRN